jgi:hypothetical protein
MPHVDEGLLHAYLDGALDALLEAGALPPGTTRAGIDAHLAVCGDCRALLEAERTIRTRAGAVLDAAAPVVEVPPFSELFGARRTRPPRRRVWPLAWAASVMLAIGAGWLGNIIFQQQGATPAIDEVMNAPAARSSDIVQESQGGVETAADARATDMGEPPPAAAPTAPAPVSGMATNAQLRDAEFRGSASERGNREQAANERRAGDLAATVQQAKPELAAAEGARRAEDTRRVAPDTGRVGRTALGFRADAITRDSAVALERQNRAPAAAAAAPVATPPPPPPSAEQRAASSRPAGAAFADITAAAEAFRLDLVELDAGRVPLSTAPVPAGLPLLQLDGGSAPTVQRGAIVGVDLARITQRAPGGIAVELIIWRQTPVALSELVVTGMVRRRESDSAAARNAQRLRTEAEVAQKARADRAPFAHAVVGDRSLADGRRELLLRSADGAFLVALRAAVSATELRALAGQLVELSRE